MADKGNGDLGLTSPGRQNLPAAVNLGLNFAVGIGLLTYLGYRLDQHRGGGHGWTLTGMLLGLVYGAYETWKIVRNTGGGSNDPKPP